MDRDFSTKCGAVVIGRNEGLRLDACLRSLAGQVGSVVYVDSGSSDNSLEIARALKAEIVELDMATPFTAARARNEGFARLSGLCSELKYVQFVDGDCIVVDDWVERAHAFLEEHQETAVVCGRRRERFPENSVYNKLCDIEWNTPVGEARACGGDALMLVDAFRAVGGFNPAVIAGEEPELCLRLRGERWKIWRLDAEMTLHDAAVTRFSQWWKRTMRGGYAYALGGSLHGKSFGAKGKRRALLWALFLPIVIGLGAVQHGLFLLLLLYPVQVIRLAWRRGPRARISWAYGSFMTLAKFAESVGIMRFYIDQTIGRSSGIIEYK